MHFVCCMFALRPLSGFEHSGLYNIERFLPVGCSLSCSLFEKCSTFLYWELSQRSKVQSIFHYLDKFLFVVQVNSSEWIDLMNLFQKLCSNLGIPLALEKKQLAFYSFDFLRLRN